MQSSFKEQAGPASATCANLDDVIAVPNPKEVKKIAYNRFMVQIDDLSIQVCVLERRGIGSTCQADLLLEGASALQRNVSGLLLPCVPRRWPPLGLRRGAGWRYRSPKARRH